jgi:hypothetical protein
MNVTLFQDGFTSLTTEELTFSGLTIYFISFIVYQIYSAIGKVLIRIGHIASMCKSE